MHPRERKLAIAGRAAALGAIVALGSAASASAGTLQVQLGTSRSTCTTFMSSWFAAGLTGQASCNLQAASPGAGPGWNVSAAKQTVSAGAAGRWQLNAPAGITIETVQVPTIDSDGLVKVTQHGWLGRSYWSSGYATWGVNTSSETDGGNNPLNSSYWGFQLYCYSSSCGEAGYLDVPELDVTATENRGPRLSAIGSNNLWTEAGGWVWNPPGDPWSIAFAASDPSGVCSLQAAVNGHSQDGPAAIPDGDSFQQCPSPVDWNTPQVDTEQYVPAGSSGSFGLQVAAANAAGVRSAPSETLRVDNVPVQLALSGPTSASSTAGTQYAIATASAGPSGVAIGCSLDGGPVRWQGGGSDRVPVAGIGDHIVSCQARNGAIGPQGQYATSAVQEWRLDIGQPTVAAIGFPKLVDLRCRHERVEVGLPARWAWVRRGDQLVRVHERAQTRTLNIERCHPRVVIKRRVVLVRVRRHGKLVDVRRSERVRVVLLPRTVLEAHKLIPPGHRASVSGWLGTSSGVAVPDARVAIMTVPNDGRGAFKLATTAKTGGDGFWTTHLPPGPSRLVKVVYEGSADLRPVSSAPVQLNVPARIALSATRRKLPWSGTVTLRGRLLGGYVPRDGVALQLMIRLANRKQPYEPVSFRTDARGRFTVRWSWAAGSGVVSEPFAVRMIANEGDYPYVASRSRWIPITFG
jgi:hypothetical protein